MGQIDESLIDVWQGVHVYLRKNIEFTAPDIVALHTRDIYEPKYIKRIKRN